VISIQASERNGTVVGACLVGEGDQVMMITSGGIMIRTRVKEISEVGRNTQGVRLIEPDAGEFLAGIEKVVESEED
jgi:DNA gyrase subunit A